MFCRSVGRHGWMSIAALVLSLPQLVVAQPGPGPPKFEGPGHFGDPQPPNFAPSQGPGAPAPVAQAPPRAADDAAKRSGFAGGAYSGAIFGGIGGLLIFLALWALRHTAKTPIRIDPATGGFVVHYSPGLRYLVLGAGAFTPLVFIIFAIVEPPENSTAVGFIAFFTLLFAALGGSVAWGMFKTRVVVTDEGLVAHSGFKRARTLRWAEIREVVYARSGATLIFRGPQKREIRISMLMAGLKPLVGVMRKHLSADKYAGAAEALARIDQLEGGSSFQLFGQVPAKRAIAKA